MRSAPKECDVLVVGSGAAGLSTALTAAALDLDVVVCEHADVLGGTSALSGGEVWIPLNRQNGGGASDSHAEALDYLRAAIGPARAASALFTMSVTSNATTRGTTVIRRPLSQREPTMSSQ